MLIAFDVLLDARAARAATVRVHGFLDRVRRRGARARRARASSASTRTSTRRWRRCASDGSPRISGTEAQFSDGELWIGSMPNALKAKDLLRDPRFALHNGYSDTTPEGMADAKLAGRRGDPDGPAPRSTTARSGSTSARRRSCGLNDEQTHLIIDVWTADGGLKQIKRK